MKHLLSKIVPLECALEHVKDGIRLMYGGFGGVGSPPSMIEAILQKGVRNLHIIGNDAAFPHIGIGRLIAKKRVASMITTHIGSNPLAAQQLMDGTLDVTFFPQGILAEKIRAGGVGIGGILVDIGLGTPVEEGKQKVEVNGRTYLIEPSVTAEVGIVYAKKADIYGNLLFDKTARNLNPLIAMAADITIAEVDQIVPVGELDPETIVTPGIYVDYIVESGGVNWQWIWEQSRNI